MRHFTSVKELRIKYLKLSVTLLFSFIYFLNLLRLTLISPRLALVATAFAAKEVEDENVGSDSGVGSEEEVEEGAASEAGDSAADVAAAKAALERKLFDTPCLFLDV